MALDNLGDLTRAVEMVESGGRRYDASGQLLRSSKGAQGEMQVMPGTVRDPGYGVAPAKDASAGEIARVGRDYLAQMVDRYGNTEHALVAYNWGPKNADRWVKAGAKKAKLPKETRDYLAKVNQQMVGSREATVEQPVVASATAPAKRGSDGGRGVSRIRTMADNSANFKAALAAHMLSLSALDTGEEEEDEAGGAAEAALSEMPDVAGPALDLDLKYSDPFMVFESAQTFADGGEVEEENPYTVIDFISDQVRGALNTDDYSKDVILAAMAHLSGLGPLYKNLMGVSSLLDLSGIVDEMMGGGNPLARLQGGVPVVSYNPALNENVRQSLARDVNGVPIVSGAEALPGRQTMFKTSGVGDYSPGSGTGGGIIDPMISQSPAPVVPATVYVPPSGSEYWSGTPVVWSPDSGSSGGTDSGSTWSYDASDYGSVSDYFADGGEVKEFPGIMDVRDYATQASERMFPTEAGQDDRRDAARHMLAAALASKAVGPTAADLLGKAHERFSSPESFFNMFGLGEPRYDYEYDTHNNRIGIKLAEQATSRDELEALVKQMAEQASIRRNPNLPWAMDQEQRDAVVEEQKRRMQPQPYENGGAVEIGTPSVVSRSSASGDIDYAGLKRVNPWKYTPLEMSSFMEVPRAGMTPKSYESAQYGRFSREVPPYTLAGVPDVKLRDLPALIGTNAGAFVPAYPEISKTGENRAEPGNIYLNPKEATDQTVAHETEHLMARRGLGHPAVTRDIFMELAGNKRTVTDFISGLAKAAPYLEEKYGVKTGYLDPEFLKEMGGLQARTGLYEILASLSAAETVNKTDLTTDPVLRETVFKDPAVRQAYNAVTGLRQTRLDPRDLPPYTPIADYPKETSTVDWIAEKLGVRKRADGSPPEGEYAGVDSANKSHPLYDPYLPTAKDYEEAGVTPPNYTQVDPRRYSKLDIGTLLDMPIVYGRSYEAPGYARLMRKEAPYTMAGVPNIQVRDMPELDKTNILAYVPAYSPPSMFDNNRAEKPNMYVAPFGANDQTVAHETEHLLARQGLGSPQAIDKKFTESLDEGAVNQFIVDLAKATPYIREKYGVNPKSGYLNSEFLGRKAFGQYLAQYNLHEIFATLSAAETANKADLTTDPVLRETVFKDPAVRQAYNAVTGLRQTRLDPRDIAPYTQIEDYPKEPSTVDWIADKLGVRKRADGSPPEGEYADPEAAFMAGAGDVPAPNAENAAAALALLRGVGELPYDLAGSAVDISNLIMSPFGKRTEEFSSDWFKKRATEAGIRPPDETDPTLAGLRLMGEFGASAINPASVTRAVAQGAQKTGQAARMLEDMTIGNMQRAKIRGAAEKVPDDAAYAPLRERMEAQGNLALAVKPPGGYFQPDYYYTVDPPVREPLTWGGAPMKSEVPAVQNFIDKQMTDFVYKTMGSPKDPLRQAIDEGRTPFLYRTAADNPGERLGIDRFLHESPIPTAQTRLPSLRTREGFPAEGYAQTPKAKEYEDYIDWMVSPDNPSDLTLTQLPRPLEDRAIAAIKERKINENGLAEKSLLEIFGSEEEVSRTLGLAPNERIYSFSDDYRVLNLEATKGMLERMLTDTSLPPSHRLTPEQLSQMDIADASVAAKKLDNYLTKLAEKNLLTRIDQMPTPKAYDDKTKWISFDDVALNEEHRALGKVLGKKGGWCTRKGNEINMYGSGENRLNVLVDNKGRPRVQVTMAQGDTGLKDEDWLATLDDVEYDRAMDKFDAYRQANNLQDVGVWQFDDLEKVFGDDPSFQAFRVIKNQPKAWEIQRASFDEGGDKNGLNSKDFNKVLDFVRSSGASFDANDRTVRSLYALEENLSRGGVRPLLRNTVDLNFDADVLSTINTISETLFNDTVLSAPELVQVLRHPLVRSWLPRNSDELSNILDVYKKADPQEFVYPANSSPDASNMTVRETWLRPQLPVLDPTKRAEAVAKSRELPFPRFGPGEFAKGGLVERNVYNHQKYL